MDWIGRTFTSDTGWDHLEALVDVGSRMAGSDGERRAAALTRDALASAGARDARREEFPIQGWTRGTSHVAAGDTEQDCVALPRSPAGESPAASSTSATASRSSSRTPTARARS